MREPPRLQSPTIRTPSLASRAREDLEYIRRTMERAGERAARFTALPGWGGLLMGVVALGASWAAARTTDPRDWVLTWLGAAVLASLVGATDMTRKVYEARASLLRGPALRFCSSLIAPFMVGALLSIVLYRHGMYGELPGLWLLSYGAGTIAAGAFSVRAVRYMGLAFMLLGVFALFAPSTWGDACMAIGFGGFHILFGLWITRHHDG